MASWKRFYNYNKKKHHDLLVRPSSGRGHVRDVPIASHLSWSGTINTLSCFDCLTDSRTPSLAQTYFWRKFPPSGFSLWCVSYRYGDLLLAPFMADNVAAGYMARLEELPSYGGGAAGGGGGGGGGQDGPGHLADEVFCQMYSLHDYEMDEYRVVGLLLAPGSAVPQALAALSTFDGFAYLKADSGSTHVKQFVSALLVGKSPLTTLSLLSGREVS